MANSYLRPITITREYHFSSAHRIVGHPKCGRLHGHNYKVEVTVSAVDNEMDPEFDWIVDFGEIDKVVNPILDQMDHRYLVSETNKNEPCPYMEAAPREHLCEVPYPQTTAESISHYLFNLIDIRLKGRAILREVKVWETHRSSASTTR